MPAAALPASAYAGPVLQVARDLVGTRLRCGETSGVVVETEAYHDSEPACHAHIGRTERTWILFERPGLAYVYRSYGIHALFNVVCEEVGTGAAVLIRALEPVDGIELMRERRGGVTDEQLCNGPGKLTQALGIGLDLHGSTVGEGPIRLEARPSTGPLADPVLVASPRIGITKAADLPWRFSLRGSRAVSKPWPPGLDAPRRAPRARATRG